MTVVQEKDDGDIGQVLWVGNGRILKKCGRLKIAVFSNMSVGRYIRETEAPIIISKVIQ